MNKLIISLAIFLVIASCKGPSSGPLVKDAFKQETEGQIQGQGQIQNQPMEGSNHMGQVTTEKVEVSVEPCQGCITIAKLMENKQSFAGKVIKIKGKVTKFNPSIMGKNWAHIQDGTDFQGGFDLTITTDIMVTVGETVTFEGKIALDKDFGYGYLYNVLLEEGKIVK
jgi:hypothetical protein